MTSRGVIFLYFGAAWAHFTHDIYCFLSLSFANSPNYSDRSPVSVHWRLCPFDYDMILCSQWISRYSGMSGTRRHIRLCHYTPGHRYCNGRVCAFPACLLNIDYVIRRNLSCLRIIHDVRFFISIFALPVLHPLWLITCGDKPFSDEWYSFSATRTS